MCRRCFLLRLEDGCVLLLLDGCYFLLLVSNVLLHTHIVNNPCILSIASPFLHPVEVRVLPDYLFPHLYCEAHLHHQATYRSLYAPVFAGALASLSRSPCEEFSLPCEHVKRGGGLALCGRRAALTSHMRIVSIVKNLLFDFNASLVLFYVILLSVTNICDKQNPFR